MHKPTRPLLLSSVLLALAALASPAQAQTQILNFDDLPPGSFEAMPDRYRGFDFSGWFHSDYEYPNVDPATPWSPYQPSSGVTNVFTQVADPAAQAVSLGPVISAASPFVFVGAHVTGYSPVTFVLTLNGVEVHRSATLPAAAGADGSYGFLASGYAGAVDAVAVQGVQGYYALDDFSYAAAPVPEPAAVTLLAAGLAAIALFARRANRREAR
ncbi:MAG: PEP-CTERM sorting domain-containing protein [Rhizobiales bacterium]|nr:PEP-CTERM sorting domain-containing protein [Rhizobacter sp.]